MTRGYGCGCGLALALLLSGCGAPVAYPRSAYVQRGGEFGVTARSNLSFTRVEAEIDVEDTSDLTRELEPERIEAGGAPLPVDVIVQVPALPFSAEVSVAAGLIDGLELSPIVGFNRLGLELRGQLLDERSGQPFSAALSAAAMTRSFEAGRGLRVRGGLDLSLDWTSTLGMLGVYVGYGPEAYDFSDEGFVLFTRVLWGDGDVVVEREELRLSIPIGLMMIPASRRAGVFIGLVPEWTLGSEITASACNEACPFAAERRFSLAGFEQRFALFVTIGVEFGTLGDDPTRPEMDVWHPVP